MLGNKIFGGAFREIFVFRGNHTFFSHVPVVSDTDTATSMSVGAS